MNSFLRILSYLKSYLGLAAMNIFFNVLSVIFSLISLTMIIPFLSLLFEKTKLVTEQPLLRFSVDSIIEYFNYLLSIFIMEKGKVFALGFICILVMVVFFLKNVFRFLALYVLSPIRNGVVRDIREKLYVKTLILPVSYFSEERKGDIMTRMTSDVQEIEWGVMSTLEAAFREPLTILFFLGAMLFISPELTVFVLVMLPLTGFIIGRIGRTLKRHSLRGQEMLGIILSIIDETLTGLRIAKAFNAEKFLNKKFSKVNDEHFRIMTRMTNRRELSSPLSEFLGIVVVVTVLWFGGQLVLSDQSRLSPETFIGFILIFSQLIPPAKNFSSAFYKIQKGLASAERIDKLLDTPVSIREKSDALPIHAFHHSIQFRNVSFAYEKLPVLKNINLTIHKGSMVALVGQSGAGKSTLADLIPRFYDPDEGAILIDDTDIKNYKLAELRKLMGIVTQESILFNDSVFNNIAFGLEDVSEEQVMQAAKIANAHDFIMKMENGYQTNIGDRGNKLSGGEKQRITIARAVIRNPSILILDEATSSLDTESEKLVQDALQKLMANRTSIVIAHRLTTIQHADIIAVMHNGEIIETGNHDTLVIKDGIYKKLVTLQSF